MLEKRRGHVRQIGFPEVNRFHTQAKLRLVVGITHNRMPGGAGTSVLVQTPGIAGSSSERNFELIINSAKARITFPFDTPGDLPKHGLNPPSVAWTAAMTTLWP